ncbi:TIGR03790 family protein [Botrimarina sp.]|uniref:TIGR03790 family protein n=1 Tax=Botrimarina sp. TaxID=2795802 RepID=UPI0032EC8126
MRLAFLLTASATLGPAALAAPLSPDEVAVVAAKSVDESVDLARYYAQKRGLPDGRIIEVEFPAGAGETLSRAAWADTVRPAIRAWLEENDPKGAIRCLVTTHGTPLRIGPAEPDAESRAYARYLEAERAARVERLKQVAAAMDQVGGGAPLSSVLDALPDSGGDGQGLTALRDRLEAAVRGAQTRLAELDAADRGTQQARLQQLAGAVGGANVLVQSLQGQIQQRASAGQESPSAVVQQYAALAGRVSGLVEARQLLERQGPDPQRDSIILRLIEQSNGLLGAVVWLQEQQRAAERDETAASLDSELSLVRWPDGYQLRRWQPNYLAAGYRDSRIEEALPTLMVARLDGPDAASARRLVDDALAAEQAGGLSGKVYLDARGGASDDATPSLEAEQQYEESLRATADGLRKLLEQTDPPQLEVVLDDEEGPLSQPATEAALYCGWRSDDGPPEGLAWRRGAIGYQLVDSDAGEDRVDASGVPWAQSVLASGAAATVVPLFDPYLVAFPRPNELFGVLVQGDVTLVEAYYLTKPFNSWAMTLVGDPLYRPFPGKAAPAGD